MAFADRSSIRRTGGVLLTALTLCLAGSAQPASAQGLFQALFGGFQRRAPEPLPPANQFVRRSAWPVRQSAAGRRSQRLRTRHCLLRANLRRPLFPAAAPCRRHRRPSCASRSARRPRPWCSPAARSTPRWRKTARAMPTSTTLSPIATRSATAAPATARTGSGSPASTHPAIRRCGRATSLRPTTALPTYNGKSRTAEFTPINTSSSEWARRLSEVKVRAGAAEREDRAGGQ